MSQWKGKVVLVTGGSSGLGLAIATAFGRRGAAVTIVARSEATLAEAAAALRETGADVAHVVADVTRAEDVERMVAAVVERHGRLDVLVNAAGRSGRGLALETTADDYRSLWELNFLATVLATQAAAPHLLAARGHVVNVGSLAGKVAARYLGGYPASKFAVSAFSQQLRLEAGPDGLHVLLVSPGPIRRDDARPRYEAQSEGLPDAARRPGGGARVKAIDPDWLAERIVVACEKRQPELTVPWKARLLTAIAALSPRLGDWIVRKKT